MFSVIDTIKHLKKDEIQKSGIRSKAANTWNSFHGAVLRNGVAQIIPSEQVCEKRRNWYFGSFQNSPITIVKIFIELWEQFELYKEKTFNISEKRVCELNEKRVSCRTLRSDEARNTGVRLSGHVNFCIKAFLLIVDNLKA